MNMGRPLLNRVDGASIRIAAARRSCGGVSSDEEPVAVRGLRQGSEAETDSRRAKPEAEDRYYPPRTTTGRRKDLRRDENTSVGSRTPLMSRIGSSE